MAKIPMVWDDKAQIEQKGEFSSQPPYSGHFNETVHGPMYDAEPGECVRVPDIEHPEYKDIHLLMAEQQYRIDRYNLIKHWAEVILIYGAVFGIFIWAIVRRGL